MTARQPTLTPPAWKTMETEPRAPMSSFRRSISFLTRPMKDSRSVETPLPLASTARALQSRQAVSVSGTPQEVELKPAVKKWGPVWSSVSASSNKAK